MTRSPPWNDTENSALCSLYFAMLDSALAGKPYSKAAMIRETQGRAPNTSPTTGIEGALHSAISKAAPLANRSKGSIEAKLMNASAAHRDIADSVTATMDNHGYRCLSNYQAALKDAMRDKIASRNADRIRAGVNCAGWPHVAGVPCDYCKAGHAA